VWQALWIYGRQPGVAHEVYANLTARASELGFDISSLKMTDQNDHCVYRNPASAGAFEALIDMGAAPLELHLAGGNHCEDVSVDFGKESSLDQVEIRIFVLFLLSNYIVTE
jgi:DhnA family fructose-bisphosphate aldolase class Ia